MNIMQKLCLIAGIVAIIGMAVFPPWVQLFSFDAGSSGRVQYGPFEGKYSFFTTPPPVPKWFKESAITKDYPGTVDLWRSSIDHKRLLLQWLLVCLTTAGLVLVFGEKKS